MLCPLAYVRFRFGPLPWKIGLDCVCLACPDFVLTAFFQEAPAIGGHGRKTPPKTAQSRQRRLGTLLRNRAQFRYRLPAALNENGRAVRSFAHQLGGANYGDHGSKPFSCANCGTWGTRGRSLKSSSQRAGGAVRFRERGRAASSASAGAMGQRSARPEIECVPFFLFHNQPTSGTKMAAHNHFQFSSTNEPTR